MVTTTLTPELEQAVTEQARQQGTTPETLTLDVLNRWFSRPAATSPPEDATLADSIGAVSTKDDMLQGETFTVRVQTCASDFTRPAVSLFSDS